MISRVVEQVKDSSGNLFGGEEGNTATGSERGSGDRGNGGGYSGGGSYGGNVL